MVNTKHRRDFKTPSVFCSFFSFQNEKYTMFFSFLPHSETHKKIHSPKFYTKFSNVSFIKTKYEIRWCAKPLFTWQPGVKAPNTENSTPLFPSKSECALIALFGVSRYKFTAGTGKPFWKITKEQLVFICRQINDLTSIMKKKCCYQSCLILTFVINKSHHNKIWLH